MTLIPELARVINAPNVCYAKGRIFFAIYYDPPDDDDAFKRAALYWKKRLELHGVASSADEFIVRPVNYEREFKLAWRHIHSTAVTKGMAVAGGQIFSHASKQTNGADGLEFNDSSDRRNGQTLKAAEIDALEKLPWAKYGFLILSGCNTGLTGRRGWCPARRFARAQGVVTVGQPGYGYFSKKWDEYVETTAKTQEIYLWAYARRRNRFLGGGNRMKGVVFKPDGVQIGGPAPRDGPFMVAGSPM